MCSRYFSTTGATSSSITRRCRRSSDSLSGSSTGASVHVHERVESPLRLDLAGLDALRDVGRDRGHLGDRSLAALIEEALDTLLLLEPCIEVVDAQDVAEPQSREDVL